MGQHLTFCRNAELGQRTPLRCSKPCNVDAIVDYNQLRLAETCLTAKIAHTLADANVPFDPTIGPAGQRQMPTGSAFGNANSGNYVRHARAPRRQRAEQIGMEQERLHDFEGVGRELSPQAAQHGEKLPTSSGVETMHRHAGRFEFVGQ